MLTEIFQPLIQSGKSYGFLFFFLFQVLNFGFFPFEITLVSFLFGTK